MPAPYQCHPNNWDWDLCIPGYLTTIHIDQVFAAVQVFAELPKQSQTWIPDFSYHFWPTTLCGPFDALTIMAKRAIIAAVKAVGSGGGGLTYPNTT